MAVTDGHGNYLTGLKPSNFVVTEDGIAEKIATFAEGNEPQVAVDVAQAAPKRPASEGAPATSTTTEVASSIISGANVFILFDTSNYMYRGFAIAQDAIADFVRSLDSPERVAFYAYSRDLYRGASLTADRNQVLRGVRSTVAGDEPALYNALLLTLKDAAEISGRKVIVVFSNGPDRASMVTPEDIGELARSQGRPRVHYRLRAHERRYRRGSLLCQELERPAKSVCRHPSRRLPPVFIFLLSPAEFQSRLAHYQGEAGR